MKNPPEYRRFRHVVLGVYIAAALFCGVVASIGGYVGARARMGTAPAPAAPAEVDQAALRGCLQELQSLYAELNNRLDAILASWPARRSSVEWEEWSPQWRTRLLGVGARCRLTEGDVAGTAELSEAWKRLSQLHRHYTTLAVQFSQEIGPHADKMHQALERARRSLPSGMEPTPAGP